eukprot:scaffold302192_cov35-Prasinocladus_malaysianus.AAC.2
MEVSRNGDHAIIDLLPESSTVLHEKLPKLLVILTDSLFCWELWCRASFFSLIPQESRERKTNTSV